MAVEELKMIFNIYKIKMNLYNYNKLKYTTMNRLLFILMIAAAGLLCQCAQPEDWSDPKDSVPPGEISNVLVEPTNGGARITYTLPTGDSDLIGAKVEYSLADDGEVMSRYASAGSDTIELEGYGDTLQHAAMLYVVDRSGNLSAGKPLVIKPKTPLIELMRRTLRAYTAFGGVRITWDNPDRKEMAVSLYTPDSTGYMVLYDTYFSNDQNGTVTFRPLESEEQQFRIELHDRWNNYAPLLDTTLTTLFEQRLPGRVNSSQYIWLQVGDADGTYWYRGDTHNDTRVSNTVNRTFRLVHNGARVTEGGQNYWNPGEGFALSDYVPGLSGALPYPMYFTVDMGRKAVYSRMNILPRLREPNYSCALPCNFEIWGTNDLKSITDIGDGSKAENLRYWTSWTEANGTDEWKNDWVRIADCHLVLSSGASKYTAGMPLSEDDIDRYRNRGFDFDMDPSISEGYRYLRWVIYETNTDQKLLFIDEILFWGAYTDE
jgi:hypothetical protein